MIFRRAVQRYGQTPQPVTPYARAGQVWDDRIGSARVQARNWRLMAFCSLGLAVGMAGAFVWQARQSRVIPYVVEVDRLGEPRALSEAETAHQPTDPQIAWHLATFIGNVRSVSMDPVLMRRDWLSAYDFVTPKAAQFLGEYARTSDPFARIGEESVSVQVTSVVRASERSFQVKWTENIYARGSRTATSQWTAILTIETRVPETADTLRKNPLGIYVDAIAWSRELEPAAAQAPAPRRSAASQSPAIEELQP
ncbi:conjugal transfer protein TrbF [Sandaracinobacter neustonicus]|uniref:Conjugal transfer protein TrbF n=1 Tax=Sandaracinobacter neustonicus TaxID=1715348 RepID=A0A501XTC3_9SPHN|nr:conjugal transfer protein TrbF [Sandaracinobacter neustonicus]TPE63337.1 conjugal transfer protein TrbF [Sandaracinobacter neustonicus]